LNQRRTNRAPATAGALERIEARLELVVVVVAFVTGATLLQPRKNVPVVVKMLKRGEPP
jgi:hypothetical protein